MTRIIDRYGGIWTDEPIPAPPGSFNRVYDERGQLVSYCMLGPAQEWALLPDHRHPTIDAFYHCRLCMAKANEVA